MCLFVIYLRSKHTTELFGIVGVSQKLCAGFVDRAANHWSHITRQTFDFDNKLTKMAASELTLEDVMEFYKEHLSEGGQRRLSVIVYSREHEKEAAQDIESGVCFVQLYD